MQHAVKTIRSLERGLTVFRHIQDARGISLHELHKETGLAKATLLRILLTLSEQGLIWRRIADGAYLPSVIAHPLSEGQELDARLAEVSSPLLEELSRKVAWPSVIAVPRLNYLEVIETNSPRAPIGHITLGPVGYRIDFLQSATGRAYLAFCAPDERDAILSRLGLDLDSEVAHQFLSVLARARRAGYATREPRFPQFSSVYTAADDGRQSIAVPVLDGLKPLGAVNLTWTSHRTGLKEFTQQHLADLRTTASLISDRLNRRRALAAE